MIQHIFFICLFFVHALHASSVAYGTAYIKNNTPYHIEVRAKEIAPEGLDAHDVTVQRSWSLDPGDTETMGNIGALQGLHFHTVSEDPKEIPARLKGKQLIRLHKETNANDLQITIAINEHTGDWLVSSNYYEAIKVISGGVSGYKTQVEQQ